MISKYFKLIAVLALRAVLVLGLATPQSVWAEYLVRGPGLSHEDFELALMSHRNMKPWVETGSPAPANAESKRKLLQQLERAQRAFLTESLESAQEQFRKITEMALDADWDEASRDAITFAHYRLAQVSENPTERKMWIRKALVFRQDLAIDRAVFPPPIVAAAREEKANLEREATTWEPFKTFRSYDVVILNGRMLRQQEELKVKVWPGIYRVTALSNAHLPFSQVMKSEDLNDFRLNRTPLASGSCEAPAWETGPPKRQEVAIAYSEDCLKSYRDDRWMEITPSGPRHLDLKPQALAPSAVPLVATPSPQTHWYHNKWVWIGAAAVLTGLTVAVLNQQQKEPSSPTVKPTHEGP